RFRNELAVGGMGTHTIQGNFIGTNIAGTASVGYEYDMIDVSSPNNLIGGTSPGQGNVVSGGVSNGIYVVSTGNVIEGNYIGTNAAGSAVIGNNVGIALANSYYNTVGGT